MKTKNIIVVLLFISLGFTSFSQQNSSTKLIFTDLIIKLKDGKSFTSTKEDLCTINFGMSSTFITVKKSGYKKIRLYKAEDIEKVTYSQDGETVVLNQYKFKRSDFLLETVIKTESANVYKSPLISYDTDEGKLFYYYIKLKKEKKLKLIIRRTKDLNKMLSCDAIDSKFEKTKELITEKKLKEIITYYDEKCKEKVKKEKKKENKS